MKRIKVLAAISIITILTLLIPQSIEIKKQAFTISTVIKAD